MTYPTVPIGPGVSGTGPWLHPSLATDTVSGSGFASLNTNVDVILNALAADVGALPGSLTDLRVSLRTSTTTAAGGTVAFDTVVADSASGWNATTHQYTIPGTGGLYVVAAECAPSGTGAFDIAINGLPILPYGVGQLVGGKNQSGAGRGCYIIPTPIRFAGGEVVFVSTVAGFTSEAVLTGTTDTNWLSLEQIGR